MDVAAILIALIAGYFSLANNREQRKHDYDLRALKDEVTDLRAEIAECHAERDGLRNTVTAQAIEIAVLKATCVSQQGEIDSLKRDVTKGGLRSDSAEISIPEEGAP